MKILVACEYSGRVRRAFRDRGHDAWSCDLLPSEDNSEYHFQQNAISHRIISRGWDMLVAFPDCTFLTVSGARHMNIPWRAQAQRWALEFVKTLWVLPIEKKCIENPVGRLSTLWGKPTQIVHPWMFGDAESKQTCLWLDNLHPLIQTHPKPDNIKTSIHHEPPGPDRWKNRSRTFQGIATAMAEQWGRE